MHPDDGKLQVVQEMSSDAPEVKAIAVLDTSFTQVPVMGYPVLIFTGKMKSFSQFSCCFAPNLPGYTPPDRCALDPKPCVTAKMGSVLLHRLPPVAWESRFWSPVLYLTQDLLLVS